MDPKRYEHELRGEAVSLRTRALLHPAPATQPGDATPVVPDDPDDDYEHTEYVPEQMKSGDRAEMLGAMLKNSFNFIRLTDRKAQTLLRINLSIMGVAFIGVPPSVAALGKFAQEGGWKVGLFVAVLGLYTFTAVCLLAAVTKIIRVIRPRTPDLPARPSRFYHASIVGLPYSQFRAQMLQMDQDDAFDEMLRQLYHTAYVTHCKYQTLNSAIRWMLGGGICGIMFAIILMVSFGLTWEWGQNQANTNQQQQNVGDMIPSPRDAVGQAPSPNTAPADHNAAVSITTAAAIDFSIYHRPLFTHA